MAQQRPKKTERPPNIPPGAFNQVQEVVDWYHNLPLELREDYEKHEQLQEWALKITSENPLLLT